MISFTLFARNLLLLLEAALELAIYFTVRRTTNAGWVLLDSVITLILAMLIWVRWPSSSVAGNWHLDGRQPDLQRNFAADVVILEFGGIP